MRYSKKKFNNNKKSSNTSKKVYKKKGYIRKSAKNKQSTNLLFKTVKLYEKQKHKYLDNYQNQMQKGGKQPKLTDEERRRYASEKQGIKKLARDLKRHKIDSKIRTYKNASILFSHNIYSFDDLTKHNDSAINELAEKMNVTGILLDKFKQKIATYKNKSGDNKGKSGDNKGKSGDNKGKSDDNKGESGDNKGKSGDNKGKSVKSLLLEIKELKTKLANVQLVMKNMKSQTGSPVCFDTTSPEVKGSDGKTQKGTTVRVCVNTKKSLDEWVKSLDKGQGKDRVITGNDLSVKAEAT